MSLKNRIAKFKYRNKPKAEQCPVCSRVEVNETMFPLLFCQEDHKPRAMHRINKS